MRYMTVPDLVFGIMASLDLRSISFKKLSALTQPFGITETSLRTGISRLVNKGLVTAERRGREAVYGFTEKGRGIDRNVAMAFVNPRQRPWEGEYWGIAYSVPEEVSPRRYRIRKKLEACRYGLWIPGLWIRPVMAEEPPFNGLQDLREDPCCHLMRLYPDHELVAEEIEATWKLGNTAGIMKEAVKELERGLSGMSGHTPETAFVLKFEIGRIAVQALAADPLLPEAILPANWPARELRQLFGYWDSRITDVARDFYTTILKEDEE